MISITIPYNQEVDCVHCVYRIPTTMYRQWPPSPLYCLPGEHNIQFYVPCIFTCVCIFIGSGLLALYTVYQANIIFSFMCNCICICSCIFIGSGLLALFIVYQVNKISIKTRNLKWIQHYFSGGAQQYSSLHHNRLEKVLFFF